MRKEKSLAKNAILNTSKTVLSILFPLVTYPYVSRILGVENMGIYTYSNSFLSYFLLFAALGIATYGIREGTQYRENREIMEQFVSELFTINMISTLIAYILLFVSLFSIAFLKTYQVAVLILSAEILFTTLSVSWVCNIYEDFVVIALRTIAMQLISLILIFIFVKTADDLNKYIAILLISNSGANLFNYFYVKKKYCRFHLTLKIDWEKHLKPIFIIFSTTIAITIYVSSDTLMLGAMTSNVKVGLYGTSVKIYTIIKNVLAAVLMVLIPRFTLIFSSNDKEQSNELFSKVFNVLTVIMLPITVGLFLLSDKVLLLFFGEDYLGAANPLRLLSIAVVFSLYSYMYTQCILIPIKKEKIVFRATVISAIVNIVLNFILIPLWDINAAAITTIIAEVITFAIAFYYSKDTVRLKEVKKNLISTFVGCLCIGLICIFANKIDSLWISTGVSVCGSIIAYFIVLLAFRNNTMQQMMKMLLKR